jgi:diguanylate cyclase (GGDEF)-like protein
VGPPDAFRCRRTRRTRIAACAGSIRSGGAGSAHDATAWLLEQIERAIEAAAPHKRSVALLHLQVGRFEELNDVLGYSSGDQLLKELARRIALTVARGATLARVGDAELALLLPAGDADAAVRTAQFVSELAHDPVPVADLMVDASVRVGIALYPCHALNAESLLRRASASGGHARAMQGGHVIYAGGEEERNSRRLELMSDFRRALEEDELSLCCQPKVDIASRRVCGAEALVRWTRPVQGVVPTAEFIGTAERAGLITPLTNWVLDNAFRQIHDWRHVGFEVPLSINLSAHDLHDPGLVCRVHAARQVERRTAPGAVRADRERGNGGCGWRAGDPERA